MNADGVVHLQPAFVARPGQELALREALIRLTGHSREEVGCLEYTLLEDPDDPMWLSIYERWAGSAAIDAHDRTAHVAAFVARFDELLAEPLATRRLRRLV
ncbi:putative quinol monooxygenase [Nocardioides mesophilus]|uniref:Antibiotic biosynthesis monooxygenase n=1 Tax=Nocardioides mesophilus TaxID=433659 RepID=A0A7G9R6C4_9ACTN|nr:putative quinol monooxygenase [Nocardioides mesophilus]QNN51149.1 antibiotic biosynthesis monooxygenase [Nocardioides mesophilus]